jgi:hypothetical protein
MPARAVPRDNQADRSLRLFGSNAGIADGVTVYDHRAPNSTTETTLLWLYSITRHLVPPAVDHPATANADTRDVALAIAARATNAQLKRPFFALGQRNNPVDVTSYLAAIKETMADLHDEDWIDDVYQQITSPYAQGNSESVDDVINRQKDIVTAYSWALFIIGHPVPADLQKKAGRGLINALPSYKDKICATTVHMHSSARTDFTTIECIARNLSRDRNGQARKRKANELTSEQLLMRHDFEEGISRLRRDRETRAVVPRLRIQASVWTPPSGTKCNVCGDTSHWAYVCPNKDKPCYFCGKADHSAATCSHLRKAKSRTRIR